MQNSFSTKVIIGVREERLSIERGPTYNEDGITQPYFFITRMTKTMEFFIGKTNCMRLRRTQTHRYNFLLVIYLFGKKLTMRMHLLSLQHFWSFKLTIVYLSNGILIYVHHFEGFRLICWCHHVILMWLKYFILVNNSPTIH